MATDNTTRDPILHIPHVYLVGIPSRTLTVAQLLEAALTLPPVVPRQVPQAEPTSFFSSAEPSVLTTELLATLPVPALIDVSTALSICEDEIDAGAQSIAFRGHSLPPWVLAYWDRVHEAHF